MSRGTWHSPNTGTVTLLAMTFFVALPLARGEESTHIAGGTLEPTAVPRFVLPMIIPPAMPQSNRIVRRGGKNVDYYEIAVRQFQQQILPPMDMDGAPLNPTTVWSYGAVDHPGTVFEGGSFYYPSFTIEARWRKPVRVKWINDLVDAQGNCLSHLLPVDQTLHWANPVGVPDTRGLDPTPYLGPVPMVTHVHGAHTFEESDGYPEAWYLPATAPAAYTPVGSLYEEFRAEALARFGADWEAGTAVFEYPNDQRATTLWYHDHTLGMTRLNVYAGPAGFFLIRGGPDDTVFDTDGDAALLPGPAPKLNDPRGKPYYELPIAIQDRSFNADGSLFYPDNRAFFEGLQPDQLDIPFIPEESCTGPSDVSPIWNPEFFGNMMVVNGRTWPYQELEARRYRLRLLNGCNSRFLILKLVGDPMAARPASAMVPFYQIGAEGGFLPQAVMLDELLMGPAERADVIVDFTNVAPGTSVFMINEGPDEPFGGGEVGIDFAPADPASTGQVMEFVVLPASEPDPSTPPMDLVLPPVIPLGPADNVRKVSLNEEESQTVEVVETPAGEVVESCDDPDFDFGPTSALLGTLDPDGNGIPLTWSDVVTELPTEGDTETWEIYNFTADAHPIHIHLIQFQVADREELATDEEGVALQPAETIPGTRRAPESWETGYKDTVIAYPGEITRVKARFDIPGLYVWHCHIVEHEDNEMMRPYRVLPRADDS